MAPVSTTLRVTRLDDEKMEITHVTALVGIAVHELDAITKADESSDTFTNPAPLITIVCAITASVGITLGVNEATETMSKMPTGK